MVAPPGERNFPSFYPVDSPSSHPHNRTAADSPFPTEPPMRFLSALVLVVATGACLCADDKIKVLIIDGQNNHDWPRTTPVLKKILEGTDRFSVDVATSPPKLNLPKLPKDATAEQKKA